MRQNMPPAADPGFAGEALGILSTDLARRLLAQLDNATAIGEPKRHQNLLFMPPAGHRACMHVLKYWVYHFHRAPPRARLPSLRHPSVQHRGKYPWLTIEIPALQRFSQCRHY